MSQHVLNKILEQSKEAKQIVGFYTYKDEDEFWAGYVLDYNDEFVLIQHLSKLGLKDGIVLMKVDNIKSVETDEDYLNAIWLLMDNPLVNQTIKDAPIPVEENWQQAMLKANPTPDKVVSLNISDEVIYGIIREFDDNYMSVRRVGSSGADEGILIYKMEDINSMHFDSLEARKRQKLYEWNVGGRR
jgi:hypothetical protein